MPNEHEVVTFGCRLNIYESQVIKEALSDVKSDKKMIIVNTCSVTKEATRQARQKIRQLNKQNPDAQIIVTGCAAQINPDQFAKMDQVYKIIGNEEKFSKDQYHNIANNKAQDKLVVSDIMEVKETAGHFVKNFESQTRSFIQIQNGCNHRCTFCIIPYGRGNSRSVPIGHIVNQIKHLVDNGIKEVVLTGVDISDFGKDLPGSPTLGEMVTRLLNLVPELQRLRFSSIDVAEIDDKLFELFCFEKRIMPHIHISLQAGDNMILKRMKRRHNREQVIEFCNKVRANRPDVAFGVDIIAGFPTETDEMFQNTLNLVKEAGLEHLHVFPYSAVENTPAAKMPQVKKDIKKQRAKLLRDAGDEQLNKFMKALIGTTQEVLVEKNNTGLTKHFVKAYINSEQNLEGQIVKLLVQDIDIKENCLTGLMIN